jgi:hypothetical protein
VSEIAVDFLEGPGWTSRLIGWFGAGSWSHVASVLSDGRYLDSRNEVLAHVPAGVHIRQPSTEVWVKKCRATLQVTSQDYASWEASLRAKIGTAYDQSAIEGFIEGKPALHTAGRWICSALAINAVQHMCRSWAVSTIGGLAYQRVGFVPFPLPLSAHEISPNYALEILATAGFTIGEVVSA